MKFERFGNIIEIQKGKKPTFVDTPTEKSIRVLQIDDLRNDNNIKFTNGKTGVFARENDILIAWDGANAGTVGYGKSGYIGSTIALLRIKQPNQYSTTFIGKFLQTQYDLLRNKSTGATIPHISRKVLEELKIPVIEFSEQLYLASILSKAENLLTQRKESIALLDEFLKSTFLEMFGTNIDNDRKWETIKLIEACSNKNDVKCGPFGTQLSKSEYQMNGIPVWGIPQINSLFKILPKEFLTEAKALELDDYSVIPLDIVMSRKGNVGKCSLFPEHFSKGIIHSDVLRIRANKTIIHPVFLLFQLKYSKHVEIQIKGVTKGAIMAGINVGMLKHIYIHRPPIELQALFAQIVKKTEVLRIQSQQSLQELENLYGNLSQSAFNGELFKGKVLSNAEVNESVVKGIPIERKTLAGWIIQMFNDNPKFGVTMFQKNLHVCEYFSEVKYETNYSQNRAGPDDRRFMKEFLGEMVEKKWYQQEQKFKVIRFVPDENAGNLVKKYGEYFKSRARKISFVLNLLKDKSLDDAELISTLYAVWNNRIIRKEIIEPDLLANDIFSWSEEKNKYTRAEIKIMYEWMNKKGLIPFGFGKEIMKH